MDSFNNGTTPSLDEIPLAGRFSNMTVSSRALVREFPRVMAAARKGLEVEIVDGKTGERYVLTAKQTSTFGQLAASAKGVLKGPRDLSAREGFVG